MSKVVVIDLKNQMFATKRSSPQEVNYTVTRSCTKEVERTYIGSDQAWDLEYVVKTGNEVCCD